MCRSSVTITPRFTLACVVLLAMLASGSAPVSATGLDVRCGASLGATARDAADGWHALPDMPRPRSELAAAVLDGWIYVAGGFSDPAQIDCFHPATGTWSTAPDLPVGVHHLAVTALDGLLYVAGGYTEEGGATGALWAYDPETDAWEERAPMPTVRGALGLVALDGKLYAVGGATDHLGGPVTGAVEIYDPATDLWDSGADMPTPREHLAVAAGDSRIFAVGGRANGDEGETLAAAAEVYDPVTDRWETLPTLPTPRGGVSGVFAAGRMVVLGGERGTTTFDTAEAFDITTGTWHRLPPMPTARHGLASAALGDTIYAIAGSTRAGAAENTGATEALTLPPSAPSDTAGSLRPLTEAVLDGEGPARGTFWHTLPSGQGGMRSLVLPIAGVDQRSLPSSSANGRTKATTLEYGQGLSQIAVLEPGALTTSTLPDSVGPTKHMLLFDMCQGTRVR